MSLSPSVYRDAFHRREVPDPEPVADGVWAIPLPLVGSPVLSVMSYAFAHRDGLIVVDCGYDEDHCWAAMERGLTTIGYAPTDVTGIVLTHNHPDHVGLTERLRAASGAWVAIHPGDELERQLPLRGTFLEQLADDLRLAGVPDAERAEMIEASRRLARQSDGLRVDRLLSEDQPVVAGGLELHVLETPGHTRGHVSLHDRRRRLLVGGDLLLPEGDVQLGLVCDEHENPVADLERSLARVAELDVAEVLPGHQYRFDDLPAHAARAWREQRERLDAVADARRADRGASAWALTPRLAWGRPWDAMGTTARRFAVMQVAARLRYLERTGG